jgi:hypothetical protein
LKRDQRISEFELALKNKTIEKQALVNLQNTQQLTLVTQQSEINRLQASEKALALQNKEREIIQKQSELALANKASQLQSGVVAKE